MNTFSAEERRAQAVELSGNGIERDMRDLLRKPITTGSTGVTVKDPQAPAPNAEDKHRGTPVDGDFRKNIIRMFEMVDDAVEDARAMREANADLRARMEQFQIKVNELQSLLETSDMEKSQLREQLAAERERSIRLQTYIEQSGNQFLQFVRKDAGEAS